MPTSIPDPLLGAFRENADELLGFLTSELRCPEQAAELRQEVYLRLRRAEPREPIGNLRAYLYRIARNLVTDRRRRGKLEASLFDAVANENLVCPAPSPETILAGQQELGQLRAALAELPAHLRKALLWYRLDGLSLRAVGLRLGVSESMASRYVATALEHCQTRLCRTERR
jgi:RNA polymerase sigma factor (sigma-70 family)